MKWTKNYKASADFQRGQMLAYGNATAEPYTAESGRDEAKLLFFFLLHNSAAWWMDNGNERGNGDATDEENPRGSLGSPTVMLKARNHSPLSRQLYLGGLGGSAQEQAARHRCPWPPRLVDKQTR